MSGVFVTNGGQTNDRFPASPFLAPIRAGWASRAGRKAGQVIKGSIPRSYTVMLPSGARGRGEVCLGRGRSRRVA